MSASPPIRPHRCGITILETTISMVIVSVMLVAALRTVDTTNRMRRIGHERPRALLLAQDLMAEILMTPWYEEPFEIVDFGPEGLESGSQRAAFDDVDDFHGWTSSPPRARDGSPLPGLTGWSRSVAVAFGNPSDLAANWGGGDVGVKVVTVTVSRDGQELASLTMARTESWRSFPQ